MNVLALCAGVGGLELGLKLAEPSSRCVCYVEGEAYVASVLVSRMAEKILDKAPVWSDVRTFDGKPWRGIVDCVTGGYPCQPFSLAGKRRGQNDSRHLWPSFERIIREIGPTECFFENVSNHLRVGFEQVHDDLQNLGYKVAAGVFSAEEVGASHQRERLFIYARRQFGSADSSMGETDGWQRTTPGVVADAECPWRQGISQWSKGGHLEAKSEVSRTGLPAGSTQEPAFPPKPNNITAWNAVIAIRPQLAPVVEPTLCGMADGATDWMDRERACGNGVVPLAAAYAYRTLKAAFIRS